MKICHFGNVFYGLYFNMTFKICSIDFYHLHFHFLVEGLNIHICVLHFLHFRMMILFHDSK